MKAKLFTLLSVCLLLFMVPAVTAQSTSDCHDVSGAPIPCPDRDGDGVNDTNDRCASEAGPASNSGCPVPSDPDGDGDGVPDASDRCAGESGPADNGGCPRPQPEEPQPQPTTAPEQPQPEQPQPEQPQPQPTEAPQVLQPRLDSTGDCVTATSGTIKLNMRKAPGKGSEIIGELPPEAISRIYATQDTPEEGLWYLLRDGWVASWVTRQGGECSSVPAIHNAAGALDITNDDDAVLIGLLLPAVQKVREAAARMKATTAIEGVSDFIMDIDPEGETWMIFPGDKGGIGTIFRFNSSNEPDSFYTFDPSFLDGMALGDGSVMPLAHDPAFRGGVFIGTFHDSDPTDNPTPAGALVDYFTGPIDADPTAAQVDYFLKLNATTGEVLTYLIPEPGAEPTEGSTPLAFLLTEGAFVIADDNETTPHIPFDVPLFFEVGPGQNPPVGAIKGQAMTIVNNTSSVHGENEPEGYKLEDVLISSVVYNLPPRSVAGWLVPDPANERLLFTVKVVDGSQVDGELILDERGDLIFVPQDAAGQSAGKVIFQDIHFALMTIPPINDEGSDGIVIGLPEQTADKKNQEIEILSFSWGAIQARIVIDGGNVSGGPHVRVFDGRTGN